MEITEDQYTKLQEIFPGYSVDAFSHKTGITVYICDENGYSEEDND